MTEHTVYCDGTSKPESKTAGYGVYWGEGDLRNKAGKVSGNSNTAELVALREAARLVALDAQAHPGNIYHIRTDSQYAGNAAKGESVSACDVDIQKSLLQLLQNARQNAKNVTVSYIPAHSGHSGNEEAHKLATQAAS